MNGAHPTLTPAEVKLAAAQFSYSVMYGRAFDKAEPLFKNPSDKALKDPSVIRAQARLTAALEAHRLEQEEKGQTK